MASNADVEFDFAYATSALLAICKFYLGKYKDPSHSNKVPS